MGAVNTVTICEDGKRWVSQIGNRHYKTHTKAIDVAEIYTESHKQKGYFFGNQRIQSGFHVFMLLAVDLLGNHLEMFNVSFWKTLQHVASNVRSCTKKG